LWRDASSKTDDEVALIIINTCTYTTHISYAYYIISIFNTEI